MARQPLMGQDLLIVEASRSHSDTPQSVVLLCMSDRSVEGNSTLLHTTLARDRHPWPRRDLNPQIQQQSDRRPSL